jgi:putative pyruvate formate lyase activating enzyme
VDEFLSLLEHCELCPRKCGTNRLAGGVGFCGAGSDCVVAHYGPHFGEEPPISGLRGSGTIFFSPCNMRCLFCQNYQISQATTGEPVSVEGLVDIFFDLAGKGVHNINLVSPTPYAPLIARAIKCAKGAGFDVPFLYNTGAYEEMKTIRSLKGLIDIYLPDLKYWSEGVAKRLSAAPLYPAAAKEAILEMHAQVGDLTVEEGIAKKGLLVRHLVLPAGLAGTRSMISWVESNLGRNTAISLMSQYHPMYRAREHPLINRPIREDEYHPLVEILVRRGFENVYLQEMESAEGYLPDFRKKRPFQE